MSSHVVDLLCSNRTSANLVNEMPHSTTTLIALFLLQTGISYGFIGFYTLGLTYVDDNAVEHIAPALIGKQSKSKYQNENNLFRTLCRCCIGWKIFWMPVWLQFITSVARNLSRLVVWLVNYFANNFFACNSDWTISVTSLGHRRASGGRHNCRNGHKS